MSDGVSVNFGKHLGLQPQMFTELNWLLNIHCANHLVELALKDTVKEAFQEDGNLYNLIYFSLKNSGETKSEIKEASNALNIQHYFLIKAH